ncbi:capsular biosynthesis protein [Weissella cibaria]|nr:capsular biosynthesis protein [Weissella cibaria]
MENVIDLGRIWIIVRRNIGLMILLGLLFGGISFGVAKFVIHPKYSASAALLVNRQHDDTQQGLQYNDQQADVQIINTYKDIITRPIILNAVVKELNRPRKMQVSPAVPAKYDVDALGQQVQTRPAHEAVYKMMPSVYRNQGLDAKAIASMISISNQTNSQVFSVNVKSRDAKMSQDVANAIAKVFKTKIASIMAVSNVSIVSKATKNTMPVSPNVKLITLAGLVVGVVTAFGWGFIKELTDRTVKDLAFLTEELDLTNLGVISYIGKIRDLQEVIAEGGQQKQTRESRTKRRI